MKLNFLLSLRGARASVASEKAIPYQVRDKLRNPVIKFFAHSYGIASVVSFQIIITADTHLQLYLYFIIADNFRLIQ